MESSTAKRLIVEEIEKYVPRIQDFSKKEKIFADSIQILWNAVFKNENISQEIKDELELILMEKNERCKHNLMNGFIGIGEIMSMAGIYGEDPPSSTAIGHLGDLIEGMGDLLKKLEELEKGIEF